MIKIYPAALLLLLTAIPAMSQYTNPRASAFVAGSFPAASRTFTVSGNSMETDFQKGSKLGFRLAADWTERWGAEAAYSFGGNDLRLVESRPPERRREFDTHQHRFMVNGLFNFTPPDRPWRPFVTFGVDLTFFVPTSEAKDRAARDFLDGPTRISTSTRFGINFGAGVEREVTQNILLRADVRDHIAGIPRLGLPDEPLNPGGVFYPVNGVMHDFEIAIGVVFRLER